MLHLENRFSNFRSIYRAISAFFVNLSAMSEPFSKFVISNFATGQKFETWRLNSNCDVIFAHAATIYYRIQQTEQKPSKCRNENWLPIPILNRMKTVLFINII